MFRRPSSTFAKQKSAWQHPFVEELNKDTYNMMAELQSVVEGALYEDAARMISSLDADAVQGVSLTANDDQLLATLPVVVRLLTREHPALRDVTERTFGQIADLRIREAMATGNTRPLPRTGPQPSTTTPRAAMLDLHKRREIETVLEDLEQALTQLRSTLKAQN